MPDCTYAILKCPNQCGVTCERAQMDQHIHDICPEQYLPCEYEYAGCDDKYRRKDKDEHMSRFVNDHRMMVMVHKQMAKAMKKYAEEMETREKEREREMNELRYKVDQLEQKLDELRHECDHRHHTHQATNVEDRYISEQNPNRSSAQAKLYSGTYIHDLPINKPWIVTIDNFTKRKDNEEIWESDIMKTSFGFKLQLNVWPNGKERGDGSHMSVWLGYLLDAEERLPFPMLMTMTLKLRNCYGKQELIRTENFTLNYPGKYRFNYIGTFNNNQLISHERLSRQKFIQNDSVVMCVTLIEERVLDYSELDHSLGHYHDSQLDGNFTDPQSQSI